VEIKNGMIHRVNYLEIIGFLAKPFEDETLVQLIHKAVAG
jgi:FixJ family two-component response regulator